MAFSLGHFVTGMFEGAKDTASLLETRNKLEMQSYDVEAARRAKGLIEGGEGDFGGGAVSTTTTAPVAPGEGSGSSTMPAEFKPPEDLFGSKGEYGTGRAGTMEENAARVAKVFEDAGLSRAGVAGALGWAHSESKFDPYARNDIKGGHTGFMQWDGPRWTRYLNTYLPAAGGGDPFDIANQAKYWLWEQQYTDEAKHGVLEKLRKATTPEEGNFAAGLTERSGQSYQGLEMSRRFHREGWGVAPVSPIAAGPRGFDPVAFGADADLVGVPGELPSALGSADYDIADTTAAKPKPSALTSALGAVSRGMTPQPAEAGPAPAPAGFPPPAPALAPPRMSALSSTPENPTLASSFISPPAATATPSSPVTVPAPSRPTLQQLLRENAGGQIPGYPTISPRQRAELLSRRERSALFPR